MRILRSIAVVLAVFVGALVFVSAPALAVKKYVLTGSFGGSGAGSGQFTGPTGVAVDESSGDVYVVDSGNNRVEEFNSTGTAVLAQFNGAGAPASFSSPEYVAVDNSGSGLDPSNGDVYVADVGHSVIDKFSSTGAYVSQIQIPHIGGEQEMNGMAVDRSGNLWIDQSVYSRGAVEEFSDTGSSVGGFSTGGTRHGFAVDSSDNAYVVRFIACQQNCLGKYNSKGELLSLEAIEVRGFAFALNPVTNNLFVDEAIRIAGSVTYAIVEYGPFGEPYSSPIARFPVEGLSESSNLAVNGGTGTVYATESVANMVGIFNEVVVPDVTTGVATGITKTTATLNGPVNPDGIPVSACQFEYRTETEGSYGHTAVCSSAPGSGTSPVEVSAEIAVTAGTTYHYRLAATNANGTNFGQDRTFASAPAVDGVFTGEANNLKATGATLHGILEPKGTDAHYYFEYGETEAYGSMSPLPPGTDAGAGGEASAATNVSGLKPNTLYHFRLVATNALGTTLGLDRTFMTPPAVEGVLTGEASGLLPTGATLYGALEPKGIDAHYYFEYGETEAYGSTSPLLPGTDAGAGGEAPAITTLTKLAPGTVYHYRLVASNEFGTTLGVDRTFATPPAVNGVVTGAASEIGKACVTLSGALKPEGIETHYDFEYGETPSYGSTTLAERAAELPEAPASATVCGLKPSTVYYYRLAATNEFGVTYGGGGSVTTLPNDPVVASESASRIFAREALLGAIVVPENSNTTYHFAYGPTVGYGSVAPLVDISLGGGGAGLQALESVSGLQPGTTYHYAVVASNAGGITFGPDQTFTTPAAALPIVVTGAAGEVSQNAASITGTVNPQGYATSYEFDIGTDTTYGSRVSGEAGAGVEARTLALSLQGLAAGTLYHYRLVATNTFGTVYGADETFTTPGFPSALLVSPVGAPLVPMPAFSPPAVGGAVTVSGPPVKHKAKAKRRARVKRRGRKAARVGRGGGGGGR